MSEAVPLAHALVARLAELDGIRILFVKGPTAVSLGARPPRPSSDVDVLCEPGGMQRLESALVSCGWHRRIPESVGRRFVYASKYLFEHSVHYIHDEWPCDLDIHFNFPGFLAPPSVVFDSLWARRTTIFIGHKRVPCADFIGQTVIVGLHALRDPNKRHTQVDLDYLRIALSQLEPAHLNQLSTFTTETGSAVTLKPLLERVGTSIEPGPWTDAELLRRWTVRTLNADTPTSSWLIELRQTPWQRRLVVLRRALLPPGQELLSQHIGMKSSRANLARLHVSRWIRALRYLPRGIAAARKADRGAA